MSATLMDMAADLIPARWNMSANDKHVLVQLGRMADNDTDDCFPGFPYIGRRTGLHEDTVKRCARALRDSGWLAIMPQERGNGATSSHLFRLNAAQITAAWHKQRDEEREEKAAKMAGRRAGCPPHDAPRTPCTVQGAPPHGAGGNITDTQTNNPLSDAREDLRDFEADVRQATIIEGVDAADPTSPGIVVIYPLRTLLDHSDKSPACTRDEVVAAVRKAAAWFLGRHGENSMRNWDTAMRMAREFRDLRMNGQPVREAPKLKPAEGLGDADTWDLPKWKAVIALGNHKREWSAEWGPPPGADGSKVPAELVNLWKGEAA